MDADRHLRPSSEWAPNGSQRSSPQTVPATANPSLVAVRPAPGVGPIRLPERRNASSHTSPSDERQTAMS
jgi:hypothetical protein